MNDALNFLSDNRNGILVLFLSLLAFGLLLNYIMWMFGFGRFNIAGPRTRQSMNFVFADAAVKIVNDFRHLLALLLVIVFASTLAYALWVGHSPSDNANTAVANLKESLQGVMATLGGLVGSIIGYYFGESSRAGSTLNSPPASPSPSSTNSPIQNPPSSGGNDSSITEAPQPPLGI
jgi:hypothetical protein